MEESIGDISHGNLPEYGVDGAGGSIDLDPGLNGGIHVAIDNGMSLLVH